MGVEIRDKSCKWCSSLQSDCIKERAKARNQANLFEFDAIWNRFETKKKLYIIYHLLCTSNTTNQHPFRTIPPSSPHWTMMINVSEKLEGLGYGNSWFSISFHDYRIHHVCMLIVEILYRRHFFAFFWIFYNASLDWVDVLYVQKRKMIVSFSKIFVDQKIVFFSLCMLIEILNDCGEQWNIKLIVCLWNSGCINIEKQWDMMNSLTLLFEICQNLCIFHFSDIQQLKLLIFVMIRLRSTCHNVFPLVVHCIHTFTLLFYNAKSLKWHKCKRINIIHFTQMNMWIELTVLTQYNDGAQRTVTSTHSASQMHF